MTTLWHFPARMPIIAGWINSDLRGNRRPIFFLKLVAFRWKNLLMKRTGGRSRADLASRIRDVRIALYGENGGPLLARALEIPFRTLHGYESRLHHSCSFDPPLHQAYGS